MKNKLLVNEFIAVKKDEQYLNAFSIFRFKEIRGNKIVCLNKKENKELEFDYYQMIVGNNLPNPDKWLDYKNEIIPLEEMNKRNTFKPILPPELEKSLELIDELFKNGNKEKIIEELRNNSNPSDITVKDFLTLNQIREE